MELAGPFTKATPLQALDQQMATDAAIKKIEDADRSRREIINQKAVEILTAGQPLDLLRAAYAINHDGDEEILRAIVYAACLQSSRTTHGLQIFITGLKGKGKTNAVKAALNLIPPHAVVNSSFSDKSFFIRLGEKIKPVVYLDDTGLTDYQVQTIKRAMTNFQTVTEYSTLAKDFQLRVFAIPPRALWLGTAVVQDGDDQLKDRFLTLGIMPELVDDNRYVEWEIRRRMEGRPEIQENEDTEIARAILQHIRDRDFVVLGFDNIRFRYNNDRRLINIALDLIEASAILHYPQRKHEDINGVIFVHPTQDDIDAALDFSMFTITDDRSEGRLTRSERALDEKVQAYIGTGAQIELTERQIVDIYGKTTNTVRALLYGRGGNQHEIAGGLLEKAAWYRLDREEVEGRRIGQGVIVVGKHEYSIETAGTFAWLANQPAGQVNAT